jgi:hypothetical protein
MLGDLEHELLAIVGSLKSVENGRELLGVELDIDDGTDNLVDLAVTNTRSAGEPAEDRGSEVEARWADGATSRRRERGTGCPGEGGNAAAREGKTFALVSIGLNWRMRYSKIRGFAGNSPLEHRDDD